MDELKSQATESFFIAAHTIDNMQDIGEAIKNRILKVFEKHITIHGNEINLQSTMANASIDFKAAASDLSLKICNFRPSLLEKNLNHFEDSLNHFVNAIEVSIKNSILFSVLENQDMRYLESKGKGSMTLRSAILDMIADDSSSRSIVNTVSLILKEIRYQIENYCSDKERLSLENEELRKKCSTFEESLFKGKKYLNYFSFDNTKQFYVEIDNELDNPAKEGEEEETNSKSSIPEDGTQLKQISSEFEVKRFVIMEMMKKIKIKLTDYEYLIDKRLVTSLVLNLLGNKINHTSKTKKQLLETLATVLGLSLEFRKKLGITGNSSEFQTNVSTEMIDNNPLEGCHEMIKELILFLNS